MRTGFGVAATVPHDVLRDVGAALLRLGFDDAWSNDLSPGGPGDGIQALDALGEGGPGLRLGLGVAALDKRPPAALAEALASWAPARRRGLLLGVGAGFSSAPLGLVRDGVRALRGRLPDVRIGTAAMGPRMCRLAGQVADVVLLNWMTPERIAWARALVQSGAEEAGRRPGEVEAAAYVRVAVGPGAQDRLEAEARRYASMPHYARHFAAMGAEPGSVGVAAGEGAAVREALEPYRRALDTLVVRALPAEPTLGGHIEVARAAR